MFTWKPIYAEIAKKLPDFRHHSGGLVQLMIDMHERGLKPSPHLDQDADGKQFPLEELDPYTFFANFNRGLTDANRRALLEVIKETWQLTAPLPDDFAGLPLVSLQKSWFMPWKYKRDEHHVPTLWDFFVHCLQLQDFRELDTALFDACVELRGIGLANLTMGMFWSKPDLWLALDKKNLALASTLEVGRKPTNGNEYIQWLERVQAATELSPSEFSHEAHRRTLPRPPIDNGEDGGFASPFDRLFRDDQHADQVLDVFVQPLMALEASEDDDVLAAAAGMTGSGGAKLQITYGRWVVFSYIQENSRSSFRFLLPAQHPHVEGLEEVFAYRDAVEGQQYVLASLDEAAYLGMSEELASAILDSLRAAKSLFAGGPLTPYADMHTPGMIDLALDPAARREVLRAGLEMADHEVDYWLLAPGEQAMLWEDWYRDGIGSVGWREVGELRSCTTKNAILKRVGEVYPEGPPKSNEATASMLWDFFYEMKVGDVVFAKKGLHKFCGWGVVAGEYYHDGEREGHPNLLRIDWRSREEVEMPSGVQLAGKALTRVTAKADFLRFVSSQFPGVPGLDNERPPAVPRRHGGSEYTMADAMADLFVPEATVDQIISLLRRKKNVVLQGAPGTGKTFIAKRLACLLMGQKDDSRAPLVQFHQSFTYEDFVQGYRPDGTGGFTLKNGTFFAFVQRALSRPEDDFVFVIDEINRGNLSKVLGELMMLIEPDKRSPDFAVPLTYARSAEETFYLPPNVHLIGTMNTADRSLSLVDYALRRRFAFVELDPGFYSSTFEEVLLKRGASAQTIEAIRSRMNALNQMIEQDVQNLGRGYRIGHSFFVPNGQTPTQGWLDEIIRFEILPLLEEYWCDDDAQLTKARQIALGQA